MKQGDREPFLQANYHNTRFISCQISKHQNAQCKPNDRIKKKNSWPKMFSDIFFQRKKNIPNKNTAQKNHPYFEYLFKNQLTRHFTIMRQ